jgi:alcohol dehydrogenase class IV
MMFELRMLGYRFLKAFMKPVVKLVPQPRPVVFVGPDAALRLCSMIGGFGFRRVLIVTDAVLVKIGVVAPLRSALLAVGGAHRSMPPR